MTPTEPLAAAWPPNTFGLDYTGADCARGRHLACPRFWPLRCDATARAGTRCGCRCHPWARATRLLDIEEVMPQAAGETPIDN